MKKISILKNWLILNQVNAFLHVLAKSPARQIHPIAGTRMQNIFVCLKHQGNTYEIHLGQTQGEGASTLQYRHLK